MQFTTATTLVADLAKGHSGTALSAPMLLILDELGYLPLEPDAAHLFFQLGQPATCKAGPPSFGF